jgi:hypothetical protein
LSRTTKVKKRIDKNKHLDKFNILKNKYPLGVETISRNMEVFSWPEWSKREALLVAEKEEPMSCPSVSNGVDNN